MRYYIDDSSSTNPKTGKVYSRVLLRRSFRNAEGKSCKETVANLSELPTESLELFKRALELDRADLLPLSPEAVLDGSKVELQTGRSVGALWALRQAAIDTGLWHALGSSEDGRRVLWMVFASFLGAGSRLAACRLAEESQAACALLGFTEDFNEDDLYSSLDWLNQHQEDLENQLFRHRQAQQPLPTLRPMFLYDVTSSYFEGQLNELAEFGYNRDKKQGKIQLVIGLLCDGSGHPISVEVFPGNTSDTKTFANQVDKATERFGASTAVFIGDRGMIRSQQEDELALAKLNFVGCLTKPEIETLLKKEVLQLGLFDKNLQEVIDGDRRYILRRNPIRAKEVDASRCARESKVMQLQLKLQAKLDDNLRTKPAAALNALNNAATKLKVPWLSASLSERKLLLATDTAERRQASRLDGCYVLKTDLVNPAAAGESAAELHAAYKGLGEVERDFRSCKTDLDLRAIYLRKEERTRAHVFIRMLALILLRRLEQAWRPLNKTAIEALASLRELCEIEITLSSPKDPKKTTTFTKIPQPRRDQQELLSLLQCQTLPTLLPPAKATASTKKRLDEERKKS
jgi:transposase